MSLSDAQRTVATDGVTVAVNALGDLSQLNQEQKTLIVEEFKRRVSSPHISVKIEDLLNLYGEVGKYDLHYSNVRTTLCTTAIGIALGSASLIFPIVFAEKHSAQSNLLTPLIMIIPAIALGIAIGISRYFLKLTHCCKVIQKGLEAAIASSSDGTNATIEASRFGFRNILGKLYCESPDLPGEDLRQVRLNWKHTYDDPHKALIVLTGLLLLLGVILYVALDVNPAHKANHVKPAAEATVAAKCSPADRVIGLDVPIPPPTTGPNKLGPP